MHPYKTIAIHRLWKMAATIWRTRNQALHGTTKTARTYKYKTQLDQKIQHILMHLQANSIAHRPVPVGYSFTVDSKQAWIRWETLSLKNHDITISNRPITSYATSTVNLGGTSQRSRLRLSTGPTEGQSTNQSMTTIILITLPSLPSLPSSLLHLLLMRNTINDTTTRRQHPS